MAGKLFRFSDLSRVMAAIVRDDVLTETQFMGFWEVLSYTADMIENNYDIFQKLVNLGELTGFQYQDYVYETVCRLSRACGTFNESYPRGYQKNRDLLLWDLINKYLPPTLKALIQLLLGI